MNYLAECGKTAGNTMLPSATVGYTHVASLGHRHRIDYVVLDNSIAKSAHKVDTLLGLDKGGRRKDHFPVMAELRWKQTAKAAPSRAQPDKAKFTNQQAVDSFKAAVNGMQAVPWEADINAHYDTIVEGLKAAAITAFGKAKPPPLKPYISQHTLELVHFRRRAAKAYRQALWSSPFSPYALQRHAKQLTAGNQASAMQETIPGRERAEEAARDLTCLRGGCRITTTTTTLFI